MAICSHCNGQGYFYFGDRNQPTCPYCAGTGQSPVIEPMRTSSGSPRAARQGRDGELLLGILGLAMLVAGFLAFQYSADVVLSFFEIVYVVEDNYGSALLYGASTLLACGVVSRYWGPVAGIGFGSIPLLPSLHAAFADDLGGFPQVVGVDAGSGLILFSVGSALMLVLAMSMVGHDMAKRKLGVYGVRSLVRAAGGAPATLVLVVVAIAAITVARAAWSGFVAANTY